MYVKYEYNVKRGKSHKLSGSKLHLFTMTLVQRDCMLAVDVCQLPQSQLFQVFITHTLKEEETKRTPVVSSETVVKVVDVNRGPVGPALRPYRR